MLVAHAIPLLRRRLVQAAPGWQDVSLYRMLDSAPMRSVPLRLWALALFSSILQTLPFPFAGPVPEWRRLFCWVCLVPLLWCLQWEDSTGRGLTFKQGWALGYVSGVTWYLTNCYWIYATMHRYGGLPTFAAAGVLVLFSLYLGLYHAFFGGVFVYLRRKFGSQAALLATPFLWTAVEMARSRITGFPWDLLGYTQVDHLWLASMATVTGAMGLSFVVAAVNSLFLLRFRGNSAWSPFVAPSFAILLILGFAIVRVTYHPPAEIARRSAVLLQDNLGVGAERGPEVETQSMLLQSFTALSLYPRQVNRDGKIASRATAAAPGTVPDIIAWAEAPTNFWTTDFEVRQAAAALARTAHAPVVIDGATAENASASSPRREFPSAAFFSADGTYLGRYDKMHLVPFGEYVPYKPLFFFAGHLLDGLDFSAGMQRRTMDSGGHRFGVFICYESVFGDEIRQFAKMGAQVFVNLSDDGWYGDTSAPWEHLDMVRMRAIENRRWVLRATNTGVTASIDPEGRVVAALPRHIRSAMQAPFNYADSLTFYTRFGDWLGWFCAAVTVLLLLIPDQRRHTSTGRSALAR